MTPAGPIGVVGASARAAAMSLARAGFAAWAVDLFADRVNRLTPYAVREATDGEALAPGNVYIAPGGMQITSHSFSVPVTVYSFGPHIVS